MKFKNDGTFISKHDLEFEPKDFEFDNDGNIHVSDWEGNKMVKYDSNFNKLLEYATGSWLGFVAVDCNVNLYVVDDGGDKVSIWTKDGQAHSILSPPPYQFVLWLKG